MLTDDDDDDMRGRETVEASADEDGDAERDRSSWFWWLTALPGALILAMLLLFCGDGIAGDTDLDDDERSSYHSHP